MDIRKILSIQKNVDIQSSLPDGALFVGTNAIIQWANDIAHDLFRLDEGLLISKSVNDILENGYDLIINSANTHKALIAKYRQYVNDVLNRYGISGIPCRNIDTIRLTPHSIGNFDVSQLFL